MNKHKYNINPEILFEQGKAIMSSTSESKFLFKVFAVNMVLSGCSTSTVGDLAGVTKSTVNNWVKTIDELGFDALKTVKQTGRPPKLSETSFNWLILLCRRLLQSMDLKYGTVPVCLLIYLILLE